MRVDDILSMAMVVAIVKKAQITKKKFAKQMLFSKKLNKSFRFFI